ncbi:sporulation protein YqfD [Congzhengia sp.]|uniref:sporulation protein YqfD n=1 Tax=Congzhengia sp. TaxID=2944168 RepID=UPI003076A026
MFIPALFSYFRGYLVITVTGNFTERFLNVCTAQNILLWDITRISGRTIRCKISVRAFKKLPKIAYNTGVNVKINARHGFPFILQQYRRRKIMLAGIFIFILFVVMANQFVWDIEVRGNETVKAADILAVLEEEGLKCGVLKSKIDQRTLKNKTMLKIPALSWLWVDKHGSKIIVDVRERVPVPEIFNPDDYCNIIAAKDAVIDSLIVRGGIPVVSIGDTVLKDTVLVTGKIPSSLKSEIRYVQSDAQIYARVWYEKTQQFSRISTIRTQTGNKKKQYTLKIFGREIHLFHSGNPPYENSDITENKHELSVFGNYLGVTLISQEFKEVTLSEELHTEESIAAQGAQILKNQIDDETLPDSELLSVSDSYRAIDDTTVEVTVKAEYKEDIAVKVKGEIEAPAPEEGENGEALPPQA